MGRTLHILKDQDSSEALTVIRQQTEGLSVLLIQGAVHLRPPGPGKVFVLEEDAKKQGISSDYEGIDYSKMLELILRADRVVTW